MNVAFADIVFHAGGGAGQVIACALEDGSLLLFVEIMEFVSPISLQSARWRCTKTQEIWAVEAVQLALAWYADEDMVVVLRA